MKNRTRKIATLALLTLGGGVYNSPAATENQDVISRVLGGQLYDNWWKAANVPEPVGDHPLYPAAGLKSGSTTWRCKECHGWDYKGVDGAYGSGSHFTGIRGIIGSTMGAEDMFDLLKDDTGLFAHGYGSAGLSDEDIHDLVSFVRGSLIDTDEYIDGSSAFIGDTAHGRWGYIAAGNYYNCKHCHGADGTELNFGTVDAPEYVRDVAVDNPWELLHKIRFGQPGSEMTSWLLVDGDDQGAADIGRYLQDDFPLADFVGDLTCKECHENSPTPDFFAAYISSAHPYKLYHSAGEVPPAGTWPHSPVPPLPVVNGNQLEWSDVEYVIGNYNWKARFIDHQGYIYTGSSDETTQWNLATQDWSPYHAGQTNVEYNCGKCHTTGYSPDGHQLGLPGLIGTWNEEGIRCEACHGPGSDHVAYPQQMVPTDGKSCADCHFRDADFRIPWQGGFTRHHQQAEDFQSSVHYNALTCNTCHDPHRSTIHEEGGLIASCTDCHEGSEENSFYLVDQMEDLSCIDCHMPYMGKSAVAVNEFTGDVRAHLFKVTREPLFAADNVYEADGKQFWNKENGQGVITLDYACMGCHIERNDPITMGEASQFSVRIHTDHRASLPIPVMDCAADLNNDGELSFYDVSMFLTGFSGGDLASDLNGDGLINFYDVSAFLTAFNEGCP